MILMSLKRTLRRFKASQASLSSIKIIVHYTTIRQKLLIKSSMGEIEAKTIADIKNTNNKLSDLSLNQNLSVDVEQSEKRPRNIMISKGESSKIPLHVLKLLEISIEIKITGKQGVNKPIKVVQSRHKAIIHCFVFTYDNLDSRFRN